MQMDELQRILTRFQTVSMPSAHRITQGSSRESQSAGSLKQLSDQIRADYSARKVLASARRGEEMALALQEFSAAVQNHLSASQAHCQRVASFLARAS